MKGKTEAWVTDELMKAIKESNYLHKKAKNLKSIVDWNDFTKKRNQVNKIKSHGGDFTTWIGVWMIFCCFFFFFFEGKRLYFSDIYFY